MSISPDTLKRIDIVESLKKSEPAYFSIKFILDAFGINKNEYRIFKINKLLNQN